MKATECSAFAVICQRKVNQKPSVQPSANQTTNQLKILLVRSLPILIDIIQLVVVGQKLESDHAWLSFVTEQPLHLETSHTSLREVSKVMQCNLVLSV